jgi:Fe-Mn family superoxide dismutase
MCEEANVNFQLPDLPWSFGDLEPFLSKEAVEFHYFGHHKAYIDKVNAATEKLGLQNITLEKLILNYDGTLYNNAAQAWNHTFYWLGLSPVAHNLNPEGPFRSAVTKQIGSLENLKKRFMDYSGSLFGSGWTWLVVNDEGEIDVINTHNGDNPLCFGNCYPLWACDVWEHAYYVDYRFKRADYLKGMWDAANWSFVEANFVAKRIPNMSKMMIAGAANENAASSFL